MERDDRKRRELGLGLSKSTVLDAVLQHCTQGSDGVWFRGVVPKILCRACTSSRFDDGTKCWNCHAYEHPEKFQEVGIPVGTGGKGRM